MGTPRDIGPGYFPALASGVLIVLGVAVVAKSVVSSRTVGGIVWQPLIGVLAPVLLFSATLKTLGLFLASALLVSGSLTITRQASVAVTSALAAGLGLFAVVVFGVALQIPLNMWPW